MKKWLEQAKSGLRNWGFNTVGWVQEVVTREVMNHQHSWNFTFEEYQWLDMPYCHMLPFVDFHQWEVETINPDFYSDSFEQWCDYVARAHCGRFADDPNAYGRVMHVLRDMPQCIGFHLCGAYLTNRVRRRGLRSEKDKIQAEAIDGFTKVKRETTRWMRE